MKFDPPIRAQGDSDHSYAIRVQCYRDEYDSDKFYQEDSDMPIRVRGDIVLVRIKFLDADPVTGVALPQRSAEAAEYVVEAVGPKVVGLTKGDKVEVIGDKTSFNLVPRQKDLFVTREANVALVYEKEGNS